MKYIYAIRILLLLCAVASVTCCKKEISYEGIQGDLSGRVKDKDRYLKDVLVTIAGTNDSVRTLTDKNGVFIFEGLSTGIYDIIFTKDSFISCKIVSFQFIGGNIPTYTHPIVLNELPAGQITNLKAEVYIPDLPYFYHIVISATITDTVSSFPSLPHARYYISNRPDVSSSNYQMTAEISISKNRTDTVFIYNMEMNRFNGYEQGEDIYIVFYPANSSYVEYYTYPDTETGSLVYTNVSNQGSNVAEFTIPITQSLNK